MTYFSDNSESDNSISDVEFDGGDDEPEKYTCVVCTNILETTDSFFNHLKKNHGWNILEEIDQFSDQYTWITFINWARSTKPTDWKLFLSLSKDDKQMFLHPVLKDDDVLMIDTESMGMNSDDIEKSDFNGPKTMDHLIAENQELRSQLTKCRQLLISAIDKSALPMEDYGGAGDHGCCSLLGNHNSIDRKMMLFKSPIRPFNATVDSVNTMFYRNFIMHNAQELFAGKTVLHLCAGSNPLVPLFLAQAKASRVFAVESSPQMAEILRQIVKCNGFCEIVQILEGKLNSHQETSLGAGEHMQTNDTILRLPTVKIDAIMCDWLSPLLMHHRPNFVSILEVYLAAGSSQRIYPRHASLHLVAVECSRDKLLRCLVDFDPPTTTRFDLSPFSPFARSYAYSLDMSSEVCEGRANLISTPQPIFPVQDLLETTPKDSKRVSDFNLTISSIEKPSFEMNALIAYFDSDMDKDAKFQVCFTTSPAAQSTHYKQTVFFLPNPIIVSSGDHVTGSIHLEQRHPEMSNVHIVISHSSLTESMTANYLLRD